MNRCQVLAAVVLHQHQHTSSPSDGGYAGPRVQRHRGPRVHGRGVAEQAEGHHGDRMRVLARGGVYRGL